MVNFTIYNDDKIRRYNGFPSMKDPYVLEKTLLRIINEYFTSLNQPEIKEFDILNPRLSNLYFTYYTSSNFYSWGELPLFYIYSDMIRLIKERRVMNNFIMTLESIYIDSRSADKTYIAFGDTNSYMPYEIVSAYISENYLNSYNYILNNNNGILVIYIPNNNGGLMTYIISVGFDPFTMSKWFCTSKNLNNINSLPYTRLCSLKSIVYLKIGYNRLSLTQDLDLKVYSEMSDSRLREDIKECNKLVELLDFNNLKKLSVHDISYKYESLLIDDDYMYIYDTAKPATGFIYTDKNSEKFILNRFNQYGDFRIDYRLLKRQLDIIKINEKRKQDT